jgi:hypothetical protein
LSSGEGVGDIYSVEYAFKKAEFTLNRTCIESFKKFFFENSKGLQRNSIQLDRHVFLDAFNIVKPLSFEGSFYIRKEKMRSRNWDFLDKSG